jgi:hypothetical protein
MQGCVREVILVYIDMRELAHKHTLVYTDMRELAHEHRGLSSGG